MIVCKERGSLYTDVIELFSLNIKYTPIYEKTYYFIILLHTQQKIKVKTRYQFEDFTSSINGIATKIPYGISPLVFNEPDQKRSR